MDERRRLHAARTAQYMRGVQYRASRFALSAALAEENRHEADVESRREGVDATFAQWSAHLSRQGLDQDGIKRFAETTAAQERALNAAQTELDDAARQRQLANQAEGEAQVRLKQASSLLRALRKSARRKRDERALQALEDRIAYDNGASP